MIARLTSEAADDAARLEPARAGEHAADQHVAAVRGAPAFAQGLTHDHLISLHWYTEQTVR